MFFSRRWTSHCQQDTCWDISSDCVLHNTIYILAGSLSILSAEWDKRVYHVALTSKAPQWGSRGTVNMTGPPQLLLFGIPPWQVDGWPHLDACGAGLRAELLSLMHRVFPIALILCAVGADLQRSWARTGRRDHQKASETHAHSDTTKLKGLSVPIPRAWNANRKAWNRKKTERAIRIPRGWNITRSRNQREESSAMQAISSWAI